MLSHCTQDIRSFSPTIAYRSASQTKDIFASGTSKFRKGEAWECRPTGTQSGLGVQLNLRLSNTEVLVEHFSCSVLPDVDEVNESGEIDLIHDRLQRVSGFQSSLEVDRNHVDRISGDDLCGHLTTPSTFHLSVHNGVARPVQMCARRPEVNLATSLHEMLTAQPDIYEFQKLSCDVDEDNDIYRSLRRDHRNLVIDSVHPDLAPHIVITSATDTEDNYFVVSQNRTAPQWPGHLMVPPLPSYLRSSAHWLLSTGSRDSKIDERSSLTDDMISGPVKKNLCPSRALFSRSKFSAMIEQSSAERLILRHVVVALHRHQRKACAFTASVVALSFRSQYDSPDFKWKSEKSFSWTDAAEPLLLASRYHWTTIIIDSPCPLIAPHIIINEAPPPVPWVRWQNATNDPQDHGHGRYLTVPSRSVNYVNELEEICFPNAADLSDESPPDTPLPSPTSQEQMTFVNQLGCEGDMSPEGVSGQPISSYVDTPFSHDHEFHILILRHLRGQERLSTPF